jgi:Transcriptional regulators
MNSEKKISQMVNFLVEMRNFTTTTDKNFRENLNSNGINVGEFIYLLLLRKDEGYTMNELSNLCKVNKSFTTKVIKDLENKKYIYRDTKDLSTRKYKIKLTSLGLEKATIAQTILLRERETFMNQFTKEELEIIEKAFRLLREKSIKKD